MVVFLSCKESPWGGLRNSQINKKTENKFSSNPILKKTGRPPSLHRHNSHWLHGNIIFLKLAATIFDLDLLYQPYQIRILKEKEKSNHQAT